MESDRSQPTEEPTEFRVILEFPDTAEGREWRANHLRRLILKHKLNKRRGGAPEMIVELIETDEPFIVKAENS